MVDPTQGQALVGFPEVISPTKTLFFYFLLFSLKYAYDIVTAAEMWFPVPLPWITGTNITVHHHSFHSRQDMAKHLQWRSSFFQEFGISDSDHVSRFCITPAKQNCACVLIRHLFVYKWGSSLSRSLSFSLSPLSQTACQRLMKQSSAVWGGV